MRVKKLYIKNYKSFGNNGSIIEFNTGINSIVGENNVGKSNILRAVAFIKTLLIQNQAYNLDDWYLGNTESSIELILELELSDNDIKEFLRLIKLPSNALEDFKNSFGNIMKIRMNQEKLNETNYILINIGDLSIFEQTGSVYPIDVKSGYSNQDWASIIKKYEPSRFNLKNLISSFLPTNNVRIYFNENMRIVIGKFLEQKLILFPEFRQRPIKTSSNVFASPEGQFVSSLLFNLKNSRGEPKKKFEFIKRTFSELYPSLEIDVVNGPEITIKKITTDHEVPLEFIGAGIAEMVIFLSHIVASKNSTFFIDEPELHLHPHSQRLLIDILSKSSLENQIIIATHSTTFVDLNNMENIIRIKDSENGSEIIQPTKDLFDDKERSRIKRLLRNEDKEFLFSRGIVLVEGDTEYGSLPFFARKLNKNFNNKAISVIPVGGNHFVIFMKLLKAFKLPYVLMCDSDIVKKISSSIDYKGVKIKTSDLISQMHNVGEFNSDELDFIKKLAQKIIIEQTYPGYKLEVYSEEAISEIKKLLSDHNCFFLEKNFENVITKHSQEEFANAQKTYPKSKVLQGIYVAENISAVPDELEQVIDKAHELVK